MKTTSKNMTTPFSHALKGAYWVPGLPHLLKANASKSVDELRAALNAVGENLEASGVKRIIYYSTQWISVLGHSFQAKKDLRGFHVDENWYDMGDMNFAFNVDRNFAEKLAAGTKELGFAAQLVDYENFPVDTGTIVADGFVNAKRTAQTNMVSCHVYSDYAATQKLGTMVRQAIEADKTPTAVIAVSGLSGNYFTTEIDFREDHIRTADDDKWNQRMMALLAKGDHAGAVKASGDFARATKADMGFKAHGFLAGVIGERELRPVDRLAYGPIYGSGNAVMAF